MKPKLISFKLCPFVQRAQIALRIKKVDFDIQYIEISEPPKWFLDISPFRKVPLLLVKDQVLFDSVAITEFIDEAFPDKLHPEDMLLRAKNRAWIEFGNECTWSLFHISLAQEEEALIKVVNELHEKLDQLETEMTNSPYFNGDKLSLVDVNFAPFLQRIEFLHELYPVILDPSRQPAICKWKDHLLELEEVKQSTVPEIKTLYHELIWKRGGFISRFLDEEIYQKSDLQSVY